LKLWAFLFIMEEIFKDIPNYEGVYQVSNLGNVKSFNLGKEIIKKQFYSPKGYLLVSLCKNNKSKHFRVHQLVAIAFLNHTRCGMEKVVNHINFNRADNRLDNLEVITQRENSNQKHLKSLSKYTGVNWNTKIKKWVAEIKIKYKKIHLGVFDCELEASKYYENALLSIENGTEIKIKKPNWSSKHKGISWHKNQKKWILQISINGQRKYIGSFKTENEAYLEKQNYLKLIKIIG